MSSRAGLAPCRAAASDVLTEPARLPVIELVGTPGAGKTTVSVEIIDLLQQRGWRASTIVDAARDHARRTRAGRVVSRCTSGPVRRLLLWWLFYVLATVHAVAFFVEHRRLSRTVVRTQLRRPLPLGRRMHICFWFFQLGGRQRFLSSTAREREVLVVDDGFLHRAVHLYASHTEQPSPDVISGYVDLLTAPALVVHVRCDEETCEERVRRRGVWRHSRRLTVGELSRYLVRSDHVTTCATHRAREKSWRVVDLENSGRPVDVAKDDLWTALATTFPEPAVADMRRVGGTR